MTLLPTPKASDGPNGGPGMRNGRGEADALPGVVSLLPTPTSQAAKHGALAPSEGGPDRPQDDSNLWTVAARDLSASFGRYSAAIARWEAVLGRPAPSPTEPGKDGRPRLSPRFVEFMMGLPVGHVTDPAIGLSRAQQLKALGNGVVPQQAALALRMLLGLGAAPTLPVSDDALLGTPNAHERTHTPRRVHHGMQLANQIDALLKTPTAQLAINGGSQHPDKRKGGGHGPTLADEVEHLLPTPAVNDMGEGKTPADWDQWTDRMRAAHGNGNGHGKSLAIEALRLAND